MCLATPLQIKSIKDKIATVDHDGRDFQVSLQLIPAAKKGDWILAHGEIRSYHSRVGSLRYHKTYPKSKLPELLMRDVKITPEAAQFLRAMIVSCGNPDCFDSVKLLDAVTIDGDFLEIGIKADDSWRMAAFERLFAFAAEKKAKIIDLDLVAWYFGGENHIVIMHRLGGHAGLGEYLGPTVGLITHSLLPLDEKLQYRNGEYQLTFKNFVDLGGEGRPFYHLGVIVRGLVSEKTINVIKNEQISNIHFRDSLIEIKKEIMVPKDYYAALNCTAQKIN